MPWVLSSPESGGISYLPERCFSPRQIHSSFHPPLVVAWGCTASLMLQCLLRTLVPCFWQKGILGVGLEIQGVTSLLEAETGSVDTPTFFADCPACTRACTHTHTHTHRVRSPRPQAAHIISELGYTNALMEKPETLGAKMLPGVSNKHLLASLGTPETDSDGRMSGHRASEPECPFSCMEPVV